MIVVVNIFMTFIRLPVVQSSMINQIWNPRGFILTTFYEKNMLMEGTFNGFICIIQIALFQFVSQETIIFARQRCEIPERCSPLPKFSPGFRKISRRSWREERRRPVLQISASPGKCIWNRLKQFHFKRHSIGLVCVAFEDLLNTQSCTWNNWI